MFVCGFRFEFCVHHMKKTKSQNLRISTVVTRSYYYYINGMVFGFWFFVGGGKMMGMDRYGMVKSVQHTSFLSAAFFGVRFLCSLTLPPFLVSPHAYIRPYCIPTTHTLFSLTSSLCICTILLLYICPSVLPFFPFELCIPVSLT
jgi:hypothetical protein